MASDDQDRKDKLQPDDDAGGYDLAPLPPEERIDELAENTQRRKRRKRSRSIQKADEVPSSPVLIQQGWLDGLFAGPNLLILLAVTFFCSPLMFPVAIFAAITASEPEARRNALVVLGFCLAPVLLGACVGCIGHAMNPS
jgi:4-amino-4-deoxy-L-arabinose transferase-like glycosyltransferase